jgi:D12 class N6 adenine-specific DNA methyltransferase
MRLLRAPFPWFGGKSRVAHLVWERFGEVRNYVEPFFGSGAVLLARPGGIETVNDADAYLANFWRAVASDPDEVARWADWPVNEADLHARHRWLVESARERVERVKTDPDYFDAKVAGWWVWGQCLWIGSGWCSRPEWTGRGVAAGKPRGINGAEFGKLPAIAGRDGGRGAYAKSRSANPRAGDGGSSKGVHQKRPVLQQGNGGRGIHRLTHQVPDLSGDSGAAGRGIHASGFLTLQAYMQALSERLRRVRVCCGDFERILGPAVTTCIGVTGVLLDPPYPEDGRAICYSHDGDGVWWRAYKWAIVHGFHPDLRIALCGYEHPDAQFPDGWTEIAWKASGGYGRSERAKANARRERIWFSPHCLPVATQHSLFTGVASELGGTA